MGDWCECPSNIDNVLRIVLKTCSKPQVHIWEPFSHHVEMDHGAVPLTGSLPYYLVYVYSVTHEQQLHYRDHM